MHERDVASTKTFKDTSVDGVTTRVRQALAAEGFGVLTEIDVQAALKKKLRSKANRTGSSAPATRHSLTRRSLLRSTPVQARERA